MRIFMIRKRSRAKKLSNGITASDMVESGRFPIVAIAKVFGTRKRRVALKT